MEKLPHIGLTIGSVSEDVLVCGDPGRATHVAELLDDAEQIGELREYRSYRGTFNGRPITVCSHGIGAPGAAIAFEELITAGARRIIRVGTCGGMQPNIQAGDLIVATAAVKETGYARSYIPDNYPAVTDLDLTLSLRAMANKSDRSVYTGIVLSSDIFYPGVETRPDHYRRLSRANVLAVEMECDALFVVGSLRRIQTSAILVVDGNMLQSNDDMSDFNPHQDVVRTAVTDALLIALRALSGK